MVLWVTALRLFSKAVDWAMNVAAVTNYEFRRLFGC